MNKNVAQELLQLTEAINGGGKVKTKPSFFEVDKENDFDATPYKDPKIKVDRAEELKRGVNDKILGDWDEDNIVDNTRRDVRVVEFRDDRHFEEALQILAEDDEIGHPTFEKGVDNKSLIFHLWKATDSMKERIEKAIDRLIDYGLVQNTRYYPHYRKNK